MVVTPKACSGGAGSGGDCGGGGSSGGEHGGGCGGGGTNTYLQCGGVLKRRSVDHTSFLARLSGAKVGVEEPLSGTIFLPPCPLNYKFFMLRVRVPNNLARGHAPVQYCII